MFFCFFIILFMLFCKVNQHIKFLTTSNSTLFCPYRKMKLFSFFQTVGVGCVRTRSVWNSKKFEESQTSLSKLQSTFNNMIWGFFKHITLLVEMVLLYEMFLILKPNLFVFMKVFNIKKCEKTPQKSQKNFKKRCKNRIFA